MSDIVLYKLVGGEEILAKQVSVGETVTVIEDAVTLVYHQVKEGVSVGFAPFMPQSEGTIALWHQGIAAVGRPSEQVIREHIRIFSGIQIATAGSI